MFSFDLSTINILLIATVSALLVIFIVVLVKLNPSTETKEKAIETEINVERQKPLLNSTITQRNTPLANNDVPKIIEKPLVSVSPTIGGSSAQTKQEIPTPTRNEGRGVPQPEKIVAPPKTESASSRRDCLHQFGYLRTLPKNAPIPDECFGCTKIVECLVKAKLNER